MRILEKFKDPGCTLLNHKCIENRWKYDMNGTYFVVFIGNAYPNSCLTNYSLFRNKVAFPFEANGT